MAQHRIENVSVKKITPSICEIRCDSDGALTCSDILFQECYPSSYANVKFYDCQGGAVPPIVLDSVDAGDAQVIRIGGTCYERIGATQDPVTNPGGYDAPFENCSECETAEVSVKYVNCADPADVIYVDVATTNSVGIQHDNKCYSSAETLVYAPDTTGPFQEYADCAECSSTFDKIKYVDCSNPLYSIVIRENLAYGAAVVRVDEACYSSSGITTDAVDTHAIDYEFVDCVSCDTTPIYAVYANCLNEQDTVLVAEVNATLDVIEYNGVCYHLTYYTETSGTLVVPDSYFYTCENCLPDNRKYQNCEDANDFIVVSPAVTSDYIRIADNCYQFYDVSGEAAVYDGADIDKTYIDCAECLSDQNRKYTECSGIEEIIIPTSLSTALSIRIDGICYSFTEPTADPQTAIEIDYEFTDCTACANAALNMKFSHCDGVHSDIIVAEHPDLIGEDAYLHDAGSQNYRCYSFVQYTLDATNATASSFDNFGTAEIVTYDDCDYCTKIGCHDTFFAVNVDGSSAIDVTRNHAFLVNGVGASRAEVSSAQKFYGTDSILFNGGSGNSLTVVSRSFNRTHNNEEVSRGFPDGPYVSGFGIGAGGYGRDPRLTTDSGNDYDSCFNFGTDNFEIGLAWNPSSLTSSTLFEKGSCWYLSWERGPTPADPLGPNVDHFVFDIADASGNYLSSPPFFGQSVSTGIWYRLQLIRIGNTIFLKFNGTTICSTSFTGAINSTDDAFRFGGAASGATINGYIDAIYARRGPSVTASSIAFPSGLFNLKAPYK